MKTPLAFGKVFSQEGDYTIMVSHIDADLTEKAIRAWAKIGIHLRRVGSTL